MLIHGWGMNSQVWQPIREALESRYHLIWVDLPGHGFNRNIDAESLENMVELIAAQTPENTHIMAWSLGGLVAQALANKLPKQVKSLSLVATTPRFSQNREENTDTPQNKKEWKYAMTEIVLNRFADNLTKDPVKTLKGFIALQFMGVENSKQAQNDLINHILYSKSFNNGMDVLNEAKQRDEDLSTKWGGVSPDYPIGQETEISNIPSKEALDVGLSILKQADLRHLPMSCPEHWIFGEFDRLIPKQVINDLKSLHV